MTAVYKGASSKNADVVLLRSYDSRREPAPEFDCKIWEAGRATCSIGLAFKPIQIGQTVFHDDGDGRFNPSPEALDEAVVNEWPGRDVGVFLSIGTGKRPKGSDTNKAEWYEGFIGGFAEAKRRLIAKIEGCEKTHEMMKKQHLSDRGVNPEVYYRLNVEVGVGEFGMNEWNRLSDISTSTRMYLGRKKEQGMVQDASAKLAKIHRARQRLERLSAEPDLQYKLPEFDISAPLAVELPAEIPESWPSPHTPSSRRSFDRQSYDSGTDNLSLPNAHVSPRSSYERVLPTIPQSQPLPPSVHGSPQPTGRHRESPPSSGHRPPSAPPASAPPPPSEPHGDGDKLVIHAPTPAQWRNASGSDKIAIVSSDERPNRQDFAPQPPRVAPPPLPPKTPLPENQVPRAPRRVGTAPVGPAPPYPLDDDPPPPVGRKPVYQGR